MVATGTSISDSDVADLQGRQRRPQLFHVHAQVLATIDEPVSSSIQQAGIGERKLGGTKVTRILDSSIGVTAERQIPIKRIDIEEFTGDTIDP